MAGSPVTRRDVVCDLGAGLGALTAPLAATGARVIAVELHPARAAALRLSTPARASPWSSWTCGSSRSPGGPTASSPTRRTPASTRSSAACSPIRHLLSADLVVAEGAARGLLRMAARVQLGERVPRHAFEHPPPVGREGGADQANGSRVAPGSWASSSRAWAATLCSTSTSYLVATTEVTDEKSRWPRVRA